MPSIKNEDLATMAAGAMAWAMAIPAVKFAGHSVASEAPGKYVNKAGALILGIGLAYITTPLLAKLLGWRTANQKVRGVALALGTAQVIDGLCHLLYPTFYTNDHREGIACAGNIFFGAGLLGIFSAFQ